MFENLLSQLSDTSTSKPINPREIFMTLPNKAKEYAYPRDVQYDVWKKWYENKDNKNTIIKMNTGSGKTVVGLMILQSCLNEGLGPVVYVVPDNYLRSQVYDEAKKLGIPVTLDENDFYYTEGEAILIIPIQKLVNGHSIFGMKASNNYPIKSIIFDDVHACLDTILSQFSIKISSDQKLYNEIITLLSDAWKTYDEKSFVNICEAQEPNRDFLVPFWIWKKNQREIYSLLKKYDSPDNNNIYFSLPLIEDVLNLCNCIVTSRCIEIIPKGITISKIKSLNDAQRRIYMSATLSDDSVFISALGMTEEDISKSIITPENSNDIGDRLFLFPRHLNNRITDEEIKKKILDVSEKYNVVVIVPSYERGKFWDQTENKIVTKDKIQSTVQDLKAKHLGMVVFVNRYDGIDLPDDACRLLVLDNLPPFRSSYDKYIQSIDTDYSTILKDQIQRIEQGMGRGVRSNTDSCCIILMGDSLADMLLRSNGISYFSNATKIQYQQSQKLWSVLKKETAEPSIDDIFEVARFSLERNYDWIKMCKDALSAAKYTQTSCIDNNTILLRKAFELSISNRYSEAVSALDEAISCETSSSSKGYLLQVKAEYTNLFDESKAQQILLSARKFNKGILIPIAGIQYDKIINNTEQSKAIIENIEKYGGNINNYIIHINSIIGDLVFSQNSNKFEYSLCELGKILGFISNRPDKETNGKGPDNLWAIGNQTYFVIECKSASTAQSISKDYCNQLGGSIRWFEENYGHGVKVIPVIIHPSKLIDTKASKVQDMRIMNSELLDELKSEINAFFLALSKNPTWKDISKINGLLSIHKLWSNDIINRYTIAP